MCKVLLKVTDYCICSSLCIYHDKKIIGLPFYLCKKNYEFCLYISSVNIVKKEVFVYLIKTFTENVYKGELPCFTHPRNLKQLTA